MIFILIWTKQKDGNETVSVLILSFINLNEVKKHITYDWMNHVNAS